MDARTLIDAFDNNELAADGKYDGKTLKVTGVVDQIDTELFNDEKYILNLTDGDEWAIPPSPSTTSPRTNCPRSRSDRPSPSSRSLTTAAIWASR